jgi:hypothetical protein
LYILVNFFKSETETLSSILCIVLPTKPNSKHGAIFFINLASDVPPEVDSFGLRHRDFFNDILNQYK